MLTAKQFTTLKKGNAVVDPEKAKERISAEFKSTTAKQKEEILKLSGISSPNSFYAVSERGSASPKIVLSLAQIMKISPFYLAGETDDKAPFNDAVLEEFFKKCQGVQKKASASKTKPVTDKVNTANKKPVDKSKKEKPTAKKAAAVTAKKNPAKIKPVPVKTVNIPKAKPVPKKPKTDKITAIVKPVASKTKTKVKIDDNSAIKLLEALAIRAEYNNEAAETYAQVKELLVK